MVSNKGVLGYYTRVQKIFVADPIKGSRHNRGCAVDLSMFELSSGQIVKMPSEYDEMTERSHMNYSCASAESQKLRGILRAAMEAEGFAVYEPQPANFCLLSDIPDRYQITHLLII